LPSTAPRRPRGAPERGEPPQIRAGTTDESACRPGSVLGHLAVVPMCGHPSGPAIADGLMRSTRRLGRAVLERLRSRGANAPPFRPSSWWGLPSRRSHLRRWWSLTPPFHPYRSAETDRRSVLCGTVPRVTPGGRYPPPRPMEPGPSSTPITGCRGRPADSSAVPRPYKQARAPSGRSITRRRSALFASSDRRPQAAPAPHGPAADRRPRTWPARQVRPAARHHHAGRYRSRHP
jgi:hypothetical protein